MQHTTRPTRTALPHEALEHAAGVLRVIAHPHRLRIVELLLARRLTVGQLALKMRLPHAAVSGHLNLMKSRNLLASLRKGREVYYHVTNPHAGSVIRCIRRHLG
ncbi:MAG: metalloregulator ArsR/SmtB family transcription factor [Phycisphaera sp.]|nr:metalloregulator ArsR/SmtB family transcription factor [Phycisphaera sp.]